MDYYGKTVFYGKSATLTLTISLLKQTVGISLSPALNPQASGRPQAGEQRYNYKAACHFALTTVECATLFHTFPAILNGTYEDPTAKDPKYKNMFTFTHYPNNQPSYFKLFVPSDNGQLRKGQMMLSLNPPAAQGVSFVMNQEQFLLFYGFVDFGWKMLPGICGCLGGYMALLKGADRDDSAQNGGGNGYGNEQQQQQASTNGAVQETVFQVTGQQNTSNTGSVAAAQGFGAGVQTTNIEDPQLFKF